jgi:tetratricopeptide (TPR) repeat protein
MQRAISDAPLTELQRADLIRRLQELEEAYQFKHNLIQESAYTSLLRNDRRALHRACANALEQTYPAELDEYAAMLAQHYAEAGDDAKTFEYARRAGDVAMRVHALPEALMQYDTAALLAARLPITPAELVDIHQKRARVLEVMGKYEDAAEAYRALDVLGKSRREPQIEIGALLSLATMYIFPNTVQNLDEALRVNQFALTLARETGDEPSQARAWWNMQQHAFFSGRTDAAVAYGKQGLEIAERLNLRELRAYILNDASRSLLSSKSVSAALGALEQARAFWRETDNLPMLVDNLSTTCETALAAGEMEVAEQFGVEARDLSRAIGNTWNLAYSTGNLMQIYALRGETRRALETGREVVKFAQLSGFPAAAVIADVQSAGIWGELGQPDRAIELLEAKNADDLFLFLRTWYTGALLLLHLARGDLTLSRTTYARARQILRSDDLSTFGPVLLALGGAELALQEEQFANAVNEARPMAERLRAHGIRQFLPELLLRQGLGHLGLGEAEAARQILDEAEQVARKMHARPLLWQILAAASDLETRQGNMERARTLRHEARDLIHALAADAPDEFRESFLRQVRVRPLLET